MGIIKALGFITLLLMIPIMANAGDMHFDDETHNVVYTIIDTNGNHVTGQTARLTVRSSDFKRS